MIIMEILKIVVTFAMTCLLRFVSTGQTQKVGGPFRQMFPQILEKTVHSINDTGNLFSIHPHSFKFSNLQK